MSGVGDMGGVSAMVIYIALVILLWSPHQVSCDVNTPAADGVESFCNMEQFNASCPDNSVILMHTARYGRMNKGRCVKQNLGYVGCTVDVINFMDRKCSGQQDCKFTVPEPELYNRKPCPGDTTPYLEAGYTCVKVATSSKEYCHQYRQLEITGPEGYIISTTAFHQGLGLKHCPWVIKASPGQRVNVTLLKLKRTSTAGQEATHVTSYGTPVSSFESCFDVAVAEDDEHTQKVTLCDRDPREKVVFLSTANWVRLHFIDRRLLDSLGVVMFKYTVVGCPDFQSPPDTYLVRQGETAVVKCNHTDVTWYLTCRGTEWIGNVDNCTVPHDTNWHSPHIVWTDETFPYGVLVVVSIGVALGVFFGGVFLGLIVIYSKRRWRHRREGDEYSEHEREQQRILQPQMAGVLVPRTGQVPEWLRETPYSSSDEGIVRDMRSPHLTTRIQHVHQQPLQHHHHLHQQPPQQQQQQQQSPPPPPAEERYADDNQSHHSMLSEQQQNQHNEHAHGRHNDHPHGEHAHGCSFSSFRPKPHLYETPSAFS